MLSLFDTNFLFSLAVNSVLFCSIIYLQRWSEEVFSYAYNLLSLNKNQLGEWEKLYFRMTTVEIERNKIPVKA